MDLGLTILTFALVAPAAAADKLVRCEVSLERSVGAVDVPGWGPDEATARGRAREAAWHLAWADRWPVLASGTVAVPVDVLRRDAALRKRLDPSTDWEVPGYAVRPGPCEPVAVAGQKGHAWEVSWERAERKVVRSDLSVAIEAARRRQCWGAWSHRMVKAAQLATGAAQERFAASWPGSRAATDGLFRCMTRVEPDLGVASGPLASVELTGPVECARPRRVDGRWTAAPAWGSRLEDAREAALQHDLGTQLRRVESSLHDVAQLPDPAQRAGQVEAVAMQTLGGFVVATDLAEQALLSCVADAPKSIRPTWTPPEELACSGWSTGTGVAVGALPDKLSAARVARCEAPFRQGASSGVWQRALQCSISCRTDVRSAGWEGAPVWRSIEPARATVEQAEDLVSKALLVKDFHLFGIATGGLVFEARYAAAFKANPTAFWGSIQQARDQGSWEQLAYWEQVGGAWVLAFRDQ